MSLSVRKLVKKCLILAIGTLIFFPIFILVANMKSHLKFIPSTMNYSAVNTLVYMIQTNRNEFHDGQGTIEETIAGDRNIFFLETGHIKKDYEINLNARQSCAVESAARMNPAMKIYLFIFSPQSWSYSNKTNNFMTQLKSYENIIIRHVSLNTYIKNSPVDEWWKSTHGLRSHWFTSHMSDVLRYLTLWKFGGIYLDLDVVVKSSLEHLKDFSCAQESTIVASGAFGFDEMEIGRRYANACLYEIVTNFRGDEWAYNGPGVITRTLNEICATENTSEMTPERCGGFQVLPPSAFYPIHYSSWQQYFNVDGKDKTLETIKNSLAIHVWNKLSQSKMIEVGSGVPYELIANEYCPKVYENCGDTF